MLEKLLGAKAVFGGSHPGFGTANALIGLGDNLYFEIIGPDPAQPDFEGVRPYGIDSISEAQLVSWVARRENLSALQQQLAPSPVMISDPFPVSREGAGGKRLSWEMAFVSIHEGEYSIPDADRSEDISPLLPSLIDWGQTAHPSLVCESCCTLVAFELRHPNSSELQTTLAHLGFHADSQLQISTAEQPGLRVVLDSPNGEIVLGGKPVML